MQSGVTVTRDPAFVFAADGPSMLVRSLDVPGLSALARLAVEVTP